MPLVKSIIQLIDLINEWAGRSVSWLLVIMVLNVFFVVVLRYIFSYGAIWMQELYVWNHSIVFLLGAGYTLLHNGHVRIDLIYRTASSKYKSIIDIFGSIFFAIPVATDMSFPAPVVKSPKIICSADLPPIKMSSLPNK